METKTRERRSGALQELCREYLSRLRGLADKYGFLSQLDELITSNSRKECVATENEVELLSRCVDDERISRIDIPLMLGKSYRRSNADGDFDKVKKLRHVGVYSKVSAVLFC